MKWPTVCLLITMQTVVSLLLQNIYKLVRSEKCGEKEQELENLKVRLDVCEKSNTKVMCMQTSL